MSNVFKNSNSCCAGSLIYLYISSLGGWFRRWSWSWRTWRETRRSPSTHYRPAPSRSCSTRCCRRDRTTSRGKGQGHTHCTHVLQEVKVTYIHTIGVDSKSRFGECADRWWRWAIVLYHRPTMLTFKRLALCSTRGVSQGVYIIFPPAIWIKQPNLALKLRRHHHKTRTGVPVAVPCIAVVWLWSYIYCFTLYCRSVICIMKMTVSVLYCRITLPCIVL